MKKRPQDDTITVLSVIIIILAGVAGIVVLTHIITSIIPTPRTVLSQWQFANPVTRFV